MMWGNFPRLNTDIQFYSPDRALSINPYMSVNRLFSVSDQSLNIRCCYGYQRDSDLSMFKRVNPRKVGNGMSKENTEFHERSLVKLYPGLRKKIKKQKARREQIPKNISPNGTEDCRNTDTTSRN